MDFIVKYSVKKNEFVGSFNGVSTTFVTYGGWYFLAFDGFRLGFRLCLLNLHWKYLLFEFGLGKKASLGNSIAKNPPFWLSFGVGFTRGGWFCILVRNCRLETHEKPFNFPQKAIKK